MKRWMSVMLLTCAALPAWGQSSSLYVNPQTPNPSGEFQAPPVPAPTIPPSAQLPTAPAVLDPTIQVRSSEPVSRLSPALAQTSLTAVKLPEPRKFAVHDLVTIIVRESTESDSEGTLDTKKDSKFDGGITDFPSLQIGDLLAGRLYGGSLTKPPKVGIKFKNEFKGDGQYNRKDTFTTRVTARIIDVKPNGTMVLEARKAIKSDQESLELVLTGTCRREDISLDNTVESTKLYDLRLDKKHEGEIFNSTDKGLFTKFFEFLFNF